MNLSRDYMLPYRGYHTPGGLCRVRLYTRSSGDPVGPPALAVLSELPENRNTSVTNMAEVLFCEVALDQDLPAGTVFVEHHPRDENQLRASLEEEIDLVTFSPLTGAVSGHAAGLPYTLVQMGGRKRPSFSTPDWEPLAREDLQRMVGHAFLWEPVPQLPTAYAERIEAEHQYAEDEQRARAVVEEAALPEPPEIQPALGSGSEYLVVRRVRNPESPGAGELHTNVPRSVIHHSPTGFETGYGGSGPADLALNILGALIPVGTDQLEAVSCYRGRCSMTAWLLHQALKERFLARMDPEGETIPAEVLRRWVTDNGKDDAMTRGARTKE